MSRRYVVGVSGISLSSATVKTLIELATPSTEAGVKVVEWGVTFNGTNAAATPVLVEIGRSTATCTGTAFTPVPTPATTIASHTTAKHTATVEGSTPTAIVPYYVPPTSGLIIQYPLGREIEAKESEFWFIRANAPAAVSVSAYVIFEE